MASTSTSAAAAPEAVSVATVSPSSIVNDAVARTRGVLEDLVGTLFSMCECGGRRLTWRACAALQWWCRRQSLAPRSTCQSS
jgi:hypothetical protein